MSAKHIKPENPATDAVKQCILHNAWFIVFSLIAIGLIIASFIVPPTGIIEPTVLAAVGEIFAFAALGTVIKAIDKGVDAQVQHNGTTVTIGDITKNEDTTKEDYNG